MKKLTEQQKSEGKYYLICLIYCLRFLLKKKY